MKRHSVIFTAPFKAEVVEGTLPPPGEGEVLVQTILSAVSPGTEMLIYRGRAPKNLAVDATIEALGGTFGFPIKFGYAAVGRVIELGIGVDPDWLSKVVFAFNPHESHFNARTDSLLSLPDDLGPEGAVFLPNMETAVSFLMDGHPVIGERVAVVGQGVVGLLTTCLLGTLPLSALVTIDPYPLRREWALRLGATASFHPEDLKAAQSALGDGRTYEGADLLYEVSGNPRALDSAIALTGDYGRVVLGSWYGDKRVDVDLGGRFHRSHIHLIATQVSTLAPGWLGRWTKARRLDVAWNMLRLHRPGRLITHRLPIEDASQAYQILEDDPAEAIQIVFVYS